MTSTAEVTIFFVISSSDYYFSPRFYCHRVLAVFNLRYLKSVILIIIITCTQPFNSRLSGTTQVSQYQKGKTNLDFIEARDGEWHWHQLGHMQVCTSLQTDNHASTPPLGYFTVWMPFLSSNQQRQSTEGNNNSNNINI